MYSDYLTTGQAAHRCSVSPDTVLKWIHAGLLPARQTAGGHHRINERDLYRLLRPRKSPSEHSVDYSGRRPFRYCWEYNGKGKLLDTCKVCSVYQMRARRCYEVARVAPDVSPSKRFCNVSCKDCGYYRLVEGQGINVLVITDSVELTRTLRRNADKAPFNLEFADCEYVCSSVVAQFRPDFAILDCSMGRQESRDITHHLGQDPRVPFVRVVLAGDDEQFPEECEKDVFARIEKPFDIKDISECINSVEKDNRG